MPSLSLIKKCFVYGIVACAVFVVNAEDISDEIIGDEVRNTPPLQLSTLAATKHPTPYVLPIIKAKNAQTITGATMFFGGMALEWGAIAPWSARFSRRIERMDTLTSSAQRESMQILFTSLGVGMLQVGGASVACAGASRVYGIYQETVSPEIKDVRVWLPYAIGLGCRGAGSVLGLIAGFSNNNGLGLTASTISLLGQAGLTTSTVMSLVYSNRWRGQARLRLSITPVYAPVGQQSGLVMSGEF